MLTHDVTRSIFCLHAIVLSGGSLTHSFSHTVSTSDGEQHEADRHHHHADDEEEGDVAWPVGHVAVGGGQQLVQHDEHHHAADHGEHDAEDELGEHALQHGKADDAADRLGNPGEERPQEPLPLGARRVLDGHRDAHALRDVVDRDRDA